MPSPSRSAVGSPDSAQARPSRLGVAVCGLGGAVATTMITGLSLLRRGLIDRTGLPLAGLPTELTANLADYESLVFGGWDLFDVDLATAARRHRVLPEEQIAAVSEELSAIHPWQAVGDTNYVRGVEGGQVRRLPRAQAVEAVREDLRQFAKSMGVERMVMLNLSSTETPVPIDHPAFATPQALRQAIEADDPVINPATLYTYAALLEGVPYVNFTPSTCVELPALRELAKEKGVPTCGKDGKTGQTLVKTVLAPAFRDRNLVIEGWYSTNLLGNRDGEALRDAGSLGNKIATKGSVLDSIMGKKVENHLVRIDYYKPRGDAKEAWDNIDLVGFCGQPMQMKVNFLARDSILAAPMATELVRLADYAARLGEGGVQEQLAAFFKSPVTHDGSPPEHDFFRQQRRLVEWLEAKAR